jgi:HSP20 family protein
MNALVTRRLFGPRSSWALRDFGDVSREIDSLFTGVFGNRPNGSDADWTPHVESYVKDETLHVRADLPGIDPKAVDVSVEENILTISGERKSEHEEAAYREVRYGRFERRLRVPEGIDPAKIAATYTNGVLEITVPIPKPVSRKVTVNVATS